MLPTTNSTISVKRLVTDVTSTWETVQTGLPVYINQFVEDIVGGQDQEANFFVYRMMTDGNHEDIIIADKIDDGTYEYDVRSMTKHNSIVWESHQYILTRPYS